MKQMMFTFFLFVLRFLQRETIGMRCLKYIKHELRNNKFPENAPVSERILDAMIAAIQKFAREYTLSVEFHDRSFDNELNKWMTVLKTYSGIPIVRVTYFCNNQGQYVSLTPHNVRWFDWQSRMQEIVDQHSTKAWDYSGLKYFE